MGRAARRGAARSPGWIPPGPGPGPWMPSAPPVTQASSSMRNSVPDSLMACRFSLMSRWHRLSRLRVEPYSLPSHACNRKSTGFGRAPDRASGGRRARLWRASLSAPPSALPQLDTFRIDAALARGDHPRAARWVACRPGAVNTRTDLGLTRSSTWPNLPQKGMVPTPHCWR